MSKKQVSANHMELVFDSKRDTNLYWSSTLFSDVYLKNNLPLEYSEIWSDQNLDFNKFVKGFIELSRNLNHESFDNWREAETVKTWIAPVMELLGWEDNSKNRQNSYIDNESFTEKIEGKNQTYRPDLIYFDKPEHKAYVQSADDSK